MSKSYRKPLNMACPEDTQPQRWDLALTNIPLSTKPGSDISRSITVNHNWRLSRVMKGENFSMEGIFRNHGVQTFYLVDMEI